VDISKETDMKFSIRLLGLGIFAAFAAIVVFIVLSQVNSGSTAESKTTKATLCNTTITAPLDPNIVVSFVSRSEVLRSAKAFARNAEARDKLLKSDKTKADELANETPAAGMQSEIADVIQIYERARHEVTLSSGTVSIRRIVYVDARTGEELLSISPDQQDQTSSPPVLSQLVGDNALTVEPSDRTLSVWPYIDATDNLLPRKQLETISFQPVSLESGVSVVQITGDSEKGPTYSLLVGNCRSYMLVSARVRLNQNGSPQTSMKKDESSVLPEDQAAFDRFYNQIRVEQGG
jgi:hypothetical protein